MNQDNNYKYDPMTGQPIQQVNEPKKSNKLLVIIAILTIIGLIACVFFFIFQVKKGFRLADEVIEGNNGSKQSITVATVGHVDHGKTTLTSAITKLYGKYITSDTISQAPEINKNGVKYRASLVEYESKTRNYYHYDLPEHEDYIKAIKSGSIKLDGAILVVSCADGPMKQTGEHLNLLQQAGVSKVIVYMSKVDMVDDEELLLLVESDIRNELKKYGFDAENTPIIKGSALKAIEGDKDGESSIRELVALMDNWITNI